MKKIILLLIISCFFSKAYNQTAINSDYDKLCGNWRWVNGTDTFLLFIKKRQASIVNGGKASINGVHKYIKNGIVLKNYWINGLTQTSVFQTSMWGHFMSENPNLIDNGSIWDLEMNKPACPIIQYNSNGTITFSIVGKSGINEGATPGPFQLPTGIVLTKL
jgi:hypothetical protein